MRRTRFDDWPCPIARTTDLLGDWWTPLVLRQAFFGQRRFDEIQEAIGIPRAVLTDRLGRLVSEGVLDKRAYQERPVRYEYRLTDQGRDLWGVLAAMWRFGEDWRFADDPEENILELVDRDTGRRIEPMVVDAETGEPLDVRRVRVRVRGGGEGAGR
ncbi:MAG: helix-turn-helix domain-containing protein [Actinomycetota bacterium]